MGAKNKVIDGDFKGKSVVATAAGVVIVLGIFKQLKIDEESLETYEVFDSERKTSASSAISRGLVGSFFLGPVGLLAAASAKKKGVHVIAIEFKDGKRSLIEVDDKIYKKLLLIQFENKTNEYEEINQHSDIPDQIRKLAELRDDGIITEDEFISKKRRLLNQI